MNEIYKGLNQNKYLKALNTKNLEAIKALENTISEQKISIEKYKAALEKSEQVSKNQNEVFKLEKQKMELEVKTQKELNQVLKDQNKKIGKKKWGQGFLIGGVTVGVLGSATAIYLITR